MKEVSVKNNTLCLMANKQTLTTKNTRISLQLLLVTLKANIEGKMQEDGHFCFIPCFELIREKVSISLFV